MSTDMAQKLNEFMEFYIGQEVTNDEWDVAPALYLLFKYSPDGEEESLKVASLPFPEDIWKLPASPIDIIESIIIPQTEKLGPPPEDEEHYFWGVFFATEGWGVMHTKDSTPEQIAQAMKDGENHVIHNRPDRVEVKMASAVNRDGEKFGLMWGRGEVVPSFQDSDRVEGRVYDSLAAIMKNFTTPKDSDA